MIGMNAMDTIATLTKLLEEARKENRELREELQEMRGMLWLKQNGIQGEFKADWTWRPEQIDTSGMHNMHVYSLGLDKKGNT